MQPADDQPYRGSHDRFIYRRPLRGVSTQFNILNQLYSPSPSNADSNIPDKEIENENIKNYQALLQNQILNISDPYTINECNGNQDLYNGYPFVRNFNLFRQGTSNGEKENKNNESFLSGFQESSLIAPIKSDRHIPKIPYKVLDAPSLQDDFYLNVVDWSYQNILAVGLGSCVYLWSSSSGKVTKLNDIGPDDTVTSINWSLKGNYLAIGTYNGNVQIWDHVKCRQLRLLKGHEGRVGSLSWTSKILSSGSRDKSILHRDIREKEDFYAKLIGHKQEVCGLKWSFDEQQLSSGGNDNKLLVWNVSNHDQPSSRFTSHTAAVKAIAWSPHQHGLLASGGGSADRCLKFWDSLTSTMLSSLDTDSQICNLIFSKTVNEIVSTHGYSKNEINIWKYPSMKRIGSLTGHTLRVLYLAMSNDGETIVTGAGDETLRFWSIFPPVVSHYQKCSILIPNIR